MVERLGNVLYWTGYIVAIGMAGFFIADSVKRGFGWEITAFGVSLTAGC